MIVLLGKEGGNVKLLPTRSLQHAEEDTRILVDNPMY